MDFSAKRTNTIKDTKLTAFQIYLLIEIWYFSFKQHPVMHAWKRDAQKFCEV